jgi:hypothetical protein
MRPLNRSQCDRHCVYRALFGGLTALMLLAACSSIPPPREQLAVSKSAVERASGPAAAEAPVELAMARDKLERANLAMGSKDYVDARRLAEQAEADANLAEAKARSMRSAGALQEVRDGIRMLREEMGRRGRS